MTAPSLFVFSATNDADSERNRRPLERSCRRRRANLDRDHVSHLAAWNAIQLASRVSEIEPGADPLHSVVRVENRGVTSH